MDNTKIVEIRQLLTEAVRLLDGVRIDQEQGRENMKRYIVGMDRAEAAIRALDTLGNEKKEEEKHEDGNDQQE